MKKILSFLLLVATSCAPIKKAQENYDAGMFENTITMCRTALQNDSTNAELQDLLAQAYFDTHKLDSAKYFAEKAFKTGQVSGSKQVLFKIHNISADSLYNKKEYNNSIKELDVALQYYPNEPNVLEKIGDNYFDLGRHEKAGEEYNKALTFGGDTTRVVQKLSTLAEKRNQVDKLISSGCLLIEKKKYDSAKSVFQKALTIKPDSKDAKYNLYIATGHQLAKNGKVGSLWDAIVQYGLASAVKPELAEPHYYMGLSYHRKDKKEYVNAFREFELAVQAEPGGKYAKLAQEKLEEEKKRKKVLEDFWNKGKKQ